MAQAGVGALLVVVCLGGLSLWVLEDARSRLEQDRPVVVSFGGLTVDRPEVWAALCLLASVLFVPLYLVARGAD